VTFVEIFLRNLKIPNLILKNPQKNIQKKIWHYVHNIIYILYTKKYSKTGKTSIMLFQLSNFFYFIFWCFTRVPVISQVFGYWLNQVSKILAGVLRKIQQNSSSARVLRIFTLQNPTPLRGFGEKS
jgi:hypothetical protein